MYSLIIPTFNRKDALTRCLEQLLRQTEPDFEVIVVDDGSTDGTDTLFSTHFTDPRIQYIRLPKNQGAYVARNAGIERAKGTYLLHWDSDDELAPEALEQLTRCFKEHPDAEAVCAPAVFLKSNEVVPIATLPSCYFTYAEYLKPLLPENTVVWALKRASASSLRFAAPNLDFMYFHRFVRDHRCYYLNESLGRVHLLSDGLSETLTRRLPNQEKSILRARALVPFLQEAEGEMRVFAPKKYGYLSYGAAVGSLLEGKQALAQALALQAWQYSKLKRYLLFTIFSYLPGASTLLRLSFAYKRRWLTPLH